MNTGRLQKSGGGFRVVCLAGGARYSRPGFAVGLRRAGTISAQSQDGCAVHSVPAGSDQASSSALLWSRRHRVWEVGFAQVNPLPPSAQAWSACGTRTGRRIWTEEGRPGQSSAQEDACLLPQRTCTFLRFKDGQINMARGRASWAERTPIRGLLDQSSADDDAWYLPAAPDCTFAALFTSRGGHTVLVVA